MNAAEHRQLLSLLAELLGTQQYDRLDEVYAPDLVTEYPQSGERFRGVDSMRDQFRNYPRLERATTEFADVIGGETYALTPMYTVVTVEGSGDRGTALFRTTYPDGSRWWIINVYELDGGRIVRTRVFFAPEFEAPEWRAPYWDKP
jgi:ketosteroid isomerase-like protein